MHRNDLLAKGRKFSGNAQYTKNDRVLHHGTLMFSSDLSVVSAALNPNKAKLETKGREESFRLLAVGGVNEKNIAEKRKKGREKQMKKILPALLVLTFLFVLVSCNGNKNTNTTMTIGSR